MPEGLTEETKRRIDEMAAEIAGVRGADAAVTEELRGHIEDKVLAYMNGEETVSEADALVLAREHFGNLESLCQTFADAHADASPSNIGTRLLVFLIMVFLANQIVGAVGLGLLFLEWRPFGLVVAMLSLGSLWLVSRILAGWRRKECRGEPVWYQRWPRPMLVVLFALMFFAPMLSASLRIQLFVRAHTEHWTFLPDNPVTTLLFNDLPIYLSYGVQALTVALALWWCGAGTHRLLTSCKIIACLVALYSLRGFLEINALSTLLRGLILGVEEGRILFNPDLRFMGSFAIKQAFTGLVWGAFGLFIFLWKHPAAPLNVRPVQD